VVAMEAIEPVVVLLLVVAMEAIEPVVVLRLVGL